MFYAMAVVSTMHISSINYYTTEAFDLSYNHSTKLIILFCAKYLYTP